MSQPQCLNCGMAQTEWLGSDRQGYVQAGHTFCCQGCATGGASACTCRTANPGIERPDDGADASLLMTARDRNGRPLNPDEVMAAEQRGEPVQLQETAIPRPASPLKTPGGRARIRKPPGPAGR